MLFTIDIPNNVSDISTDINPWEKWELKPDMDCVTKLAKQFSDNFKKYKLPDIAKLGGPVL